MRAPMTDDIRWQQRLASYQRALAQLEAAVTLSQSRPLSELEQQGLIQAFEFTHELAWNVMKDYLSIKVICQSPVPAMPPGRLLRFS